MRKIMVLQHVGHEPLGTLNPMLKAAGFRIKYVNFGRNPDEVPSLESYSGLIVLGGPMGVYEADRYPHLKTEMKLIEDAFKRDIPVLGICLGAQLMAHVLGGKVFKAPQWEFGWHQIDLTQKAGMDPLFGHYSSAEKVFQIHQDTFELPKSTDHLAKSLICENQAFRYGEKAYGLQFHLEVDQPMILRWLNRPENKQLIKDSGGLFEASQIAQETQKLILRSTELSQATFQKFIEIFQLPERPELLKSER